MLRRKILILFLCQSSKSRDNDSSKAEAGEEGGDPEVASPGKEETDPPVEEECSLPDLDHHAIKNKVINYENRIAVV